MKKVVSAVLALAMAMVVFTGCANKESENITPTPSPEPVESRTPAPTPEVPEEDPNYPTVLAMWKDMDGYWANAKGEYVLFGLDENGKAVLHTYDKDGNVTGFAKATAVMSSTKTGYFMTFDWYESEDDTSSLKNDKETNISIDMEKYSEGYVSISKENGESKVYVKVGENLDKLENAVKKAETLK